MIPQNNQYTGINLVLVFDRERGRPGRAMKASACFAISDLRSCMSLTTFSSPNVSPDTYTQMGTTRLIHALRRTARTLDEIHGALVPGGSCWKRREWGSVQPAG
jgi:hypothetical protein